MNSVFLSFEHGIRLSVWQKTLFLRVQREMMSATLARGGVRYQGQVAQLFARLLGFWSLVGLARLADSGPLRTGESLSRLQSDF